MKIYIENDDGTKIEVKEIKTLSKDSEVVLLMIDMHMRPTDLDMLEKRYTDKIGKQCVILDSVFTKVLGV